jgi:hypothetical protein
METLNHEITRSFQQDSIASGPGEHVVDRGATILLAGNDLPCVHDEMTWGSFKGHGHRLAPMEVVACGSSASELQASGIGEEREEIVDL